MNDVFDVGNMLAFLLHYPRVHLFLVFSLFAVIPLAAIAWAWAHEHVQDAARWRRH